MDEALDVLPVAAPARRAQTVAGKLREFFSSFFAGARHIDDLPNDLLVSVFIAVEDLRWVRHTVPLVCRRWAELYRWRGASPLHETLEVDFRKEVGRLKAKERAFRSPVVHASRVISWAERRAGSVRTLHLNGKYSRALEDFSSEDLGRLVAVVGSSLTELRIGRGIRGKCRTSVNELCQKPFWDSVRASVVPHGQLRSFVVRGADASESDVEPLGQLAGSLEELVLDLFGRFEGLPRFPESFCALTKLRRLVLLSHRRITAIPAQISSLKKLKELKLNCSLSSLPKELGELSGLTKLDLYGNSRLGNAPQDEAFPAALGRMKSLRVLHLGYCGLRAVPAFVGELESLEILDLNDNEDQMTATLDFLIEGCPRLRKVKMRKGWRNRTRESRARLRAFKAKLLAKNPDAVVKY